MIRTLLAPALFAASISAVAAAEIPVAAPAALAATAPAQKAKGPKLVEPHLRIARSGLKGHARIALTFDACMGKVDDRILSVLVSERIPATIFVTAGWL